MPSDSAVQVGAAGAGAAGSLVGAEGHDSDIVVHHARPTVFVQFSLRLYGPVARRRIDRHPGLGQKLAKAADPIVPIAYLASVYLRVTIAALMGVLLFLIVLVVTGGEGSPRAMVGTLLAAPIFGIITYSYFLLKPDLEASSRRRDLESHLPYALNFLAALASAGVVPDELFGALGKQPVYGQVAREASMIHRDTKLFSKDMVRAMADAGRRSPSKQFEEFLTGAVSTVTSGGDLKTYFLAKAEHFTAENHRKQKAFLESMGVMAESYVVVAAAAPLFLIVILSVMMLLSSDSSDPTFFLNIIILGALPVIHGAFIYILRTMRAD